MDLAHLFGLLALLTSVMFELGSTYNEEYTYYSHKVLEFPRHNVQNNVVSSIYYHSWIFSEHHHIFRSIYQFNQSFIAKEIHHHSFQHNCFRFFSGSKIQKGTIEC